jgi:hypothetical protein
VSAVGIRNGSINNVYNNNWYGGSHYGGHYGGYYGGYYGGHYHHHGDAWAWALVGWTLGAMTYSSGYTTYTNPYPTTVVVTSSGSTVAYDQPITVVAEQTTPKDPVAMDAVAQKASSFVAESQAAFKAQNYLLALEAANKAVAEFPGDAAVHEYRALVLFVLGKYSDSAGVLNPVLAGGPGWNWTTMVKLYDSQETYTSQLRKLEDYVDSKPKAADGHFLLGYHYMVCAYSEKAAAHFKMASELQPADTVSKQLQSLCEAAAKAASGETGDAEEPAAKPETETVPVPLEKLGGTWVADKGKAGVITLALQNDGKFAWNYAKDGKGQGFAGAYRMNEEGLLVLDSDGNQMVASVALPKDNQMKFIAAGGPPGDPGLEFIKKK